MNRLTNAVDNTGRYNLDLVQYDANGNITKLKRKVHRNTAASSFGLMDDLSYSYTGNQLKVVNESNNGHKNFGFIDGARKSKEYFFDANGNLTKDENKKISNISYNYMNFPTQVTINSSEHNGNVQFVYAADGTKMRKIVSTTGAQTDYAGSFVYENGKLVQFGQPEGYVEPNDLGGYNYFYSYLDHLGSVRLTYSDFNGDGSIAPSSEVMQERNTYPFGLEHKGYNGNINGRENNYQTYLGQEMNKELDLGWLTFRYRNYMPEIGRFFGSDPIAEEFYYQTNYQFASNNPIWKIELEGLEGAKTNDGTDITDLEKKKAFSSFSPNYKPEGQVFSASGTLRGKLGPSLKGGISLGKKAKALVDLSIVQGSGTVTNKNGVTVKGSAKILNATAGFASPVGESQLNLSAGEINLSANENEGFKLDASLIKGDTKAKTRNGVTVSDSFTLVSSDPNSNSSSNGTRVKVESGSINGTFDGDTFGVGVGVGPVSGSVSMDKENAGNVISNFFNFLTDLIVNGVKIRPSEEDIKGQ